MTFVIRILDALGSVRALHQLGPDHTDRSLDARNGVTREAQRLDEDLVHRLIARDNRSTRHRPCWSRPRSTCRLGPLCLRNELLIGILDLFRSRRIQTLTREEPAA